MSTWQIICDVAMLVIIALMIIIGIKRGFVKSFFKSTKMLIVILVTVLIGAILVAPCKENITNGMFEGKVSTLLVQEVEKSGAQLDADALKSELPATLVGLVPMDEVEEYLERMPQLNIGNTFVLEGNVND